MIVCFNLVYFFIMCPQTLAKSAMPVLQLFPPANPIALFHDHDYLKFSVAEEFLSREEVCCVDVELLFSEVLQ